MICIGERLGLEEVQEAVSMAGQSVEDKDEGKGRGKGKGKDGEEEGKEGKGGDKENGNTGGEVRKKDADIHGKQEKESASSDDSDIGSGDDDDDSKRGEQVQKLEESVSANPYRKETHVQLISALRKAGLLEKLRDAREAMNMLYPLTPNMWREWAQDEARLASGAKEVQAVEALYERGIQDYLSVILWLEYLNFVEEHVDASDGEGEGVTKMRRLYEQALAAVGLHFAEGGKVWKAYIEFEQALLQLLCVSSGEGKVKQVQNVRSLFRRQLTIPSGNLAETLQEYKEWEGLQGNRIGDDSDELSGLPSHVCSAYKKALQLCSVRQVHEGKIEKGKPGEAEHLQHYLGYISIGGASGEPARAQVLYERAVSAFPVSHEIWVKYTQYLETHLKVASILQGAYARAVRNCPWVEPLWRSYLLALERCHASEFELSAVFEQSLLGGFQTAEEYLDLFLVRSDGLRRRIMATEESPDQQSAMVLLHDTFDRASQFLAKYYPDFVDPTLQLYAYWADMEAHIAKDLVAARRVWEGLIKSSGWMTQVWQAYISMELSLKNIKETRAIYSRCYSRRMEGNETELMCSSWLRFEREHGSLEDYDRAAMKVAPRLAEVQAMQLQQEMKSDHAFVQSRPQTGPIEGKKKTKEQLSRVGQKNYSQENSSDSSTGKRKHGVGSSKEPKPVLKRPKVDKEPLLNPQKLDQGEALPTTATEFSNTQHKHVSPDSKEKDVVMDKAPGKTSQRPNKYMDECTAFVSNVAFEVTEEKLREFFSSVAGVKEVRVLRAKLTGRPRGVAYVDFEDEESLTAAVGKDKEELCGRQLGVARSAPRTGGGGGRGRGDFGHRGGRQGRGQGDESRGESSGGRAHGVGNALGHRPGGKANVARTNTFAVPRTVALQPLGWNPSLQAATGGEAPNSNDDFRKMLFSKK